MSETRQDFAMHQGESKRLEFLVTDEDGNPLDVSASDEIWWAAYELAGDQTEVIGPKRLTDDDVITVEDGDGTGDKVIVPLEPDDTGQDATPEGPIRPDQYHHELRIQDGSGAEHVLATGTLQLDPSSTINEP